MSTNVVKLPTAARSYIRVRRVGITWRVELVTPSPGEPIATMLGMSTDWSAAVEYAREKGHKMQRPVRLPRGST